MPNLGPVTQLVDPNGNPIGTTSNPLAVALTGSSAVIGTQPNAPVYSATLTIPSGNAQTAFTVDIGTLLTSLGDMYPARAFMVAMYNGTAVAIEDASLVLSQTVGAGSVSSSYQMLPSAMYINGVLSNYLAAGSSGLSWARMGDGVLPEMTVTLTFFSAPTGGNVSIIVIPVADSAEMTGFTDVNGGIAYQGGVVPTVAAVLMAQSSLDSEAVGPVALLSGVAGEGPGILATPCSGTTSVAITTATTTSLKANPGVIGTISNASGAATGTITVFDSTTASGKTLWQGTLSAGQVLPIGMPCTVGITVLTAAADAIAVSFN